MTLGTFQALVGRWSAATFPTQTLTSKIEHLRREVVELASDPSDPMEMADCLILLCGIAELAGADLMTAALAKFSELQTRTWGEPDADGVQSHIKEDSLAASGPSDTPETDAVDAKTSEVHAAFFMMRSHAWKLERDRNRLEHAKQATITRLNNIITKLSEP